MFEALGAGDCVGLAELLVELGAGLTEDEGEGDALELVDVFGTGEELGAVGAGVVSAVGLEFTFGAATFTPLLQTNFLPLLMHLYLYPETIVDAFNFVHVAPALTAANPDAVPMDMARETNIETTTRRRTSSMI